MIVNENTFRIKVDAVLIAFTAKDINKVEFPKGLHPPSNVFLAKSVILFSASSAFKTSIKFKEMELKVIKWF